MNSISSTRLTAPKAFTGEIVRKRLIDSVQSNRERYFYIHAGAGYGKTTLLSQLAELYEDTVWLMLAGENDLLEFVNSLCEAVRHTFPDYDFNVSEYIPFTDKDNFPIIVANALIVSFEKLDRPFTLIQDDLQTIQSRKIKELIACFLKYAPRNIRVLMCSREALWPELLPLFLRGEILEIKQDELAFSKEETAQILGFEDNEIYSITEGWPLAVGSFRLLLENGVQPPDISAKGKDALYAYLFCEGVSRMSPEMVRFLKDSACFEDLDAQMLDSVLNQKNTRLMLESLVSRNIFTSKTRDGHYRYHALFRESLMKDCDVSKESVLKQKAAQYYYDSKNFFVAAEYAVKSDDKELLQTIILASYKDYMKIGKFSELRIWFQALGDVQEPSPQILIAKGAFLSSTGNFIGAKKCLADAIPLLNEKNNELYFEAMVHKARILRNNESFDASNQLLDELIKKLDSCASETGYAVVIEKLYNLCWSSQIDEAYALAEHSIEACARAGNMKIKGWFERYLSAVSFFAGRMNEAVNYYEKSLLLPEDERRFLDLHSIGIYAAKAYQMLGDRTRAHSVLSEELKKMRNTGKFEELWSGYLFAAEIFFQDASIDRANGIYDSYETTKKYFTLADEYAPLYRKADFQMHWANMQRLTYSLMFADGPKEEIIDELFANMDSADDYLKSIVLARLFGYMAAVSDLKRASKYAMLCIEIGEKSHMYLHSALAYGMLARAALAENSLTEAAQFTERFLRLCYENGILEYFRARKDYDPILAFASDNGIEPEITKQLMRFSGYKLKKAYVKTFGGFSVYPNKDSANPLKIARKKKRELLAFLLDAGEAGVTKEQICDAVWPESESGNIKKMIGVNLAQIKNDLSGLGIENALLCREKRYSICRDEIECDFELFESTAENYKNTGSQSEIQRLLNLYSGEYLSDFEAFWATSKRIKFQNIFDALITR